jgi:hypothetical protein
VFGFLEHPLLFTISRVFYEKIGNAMVIYNIRGIVLLTQIEHHLLEELLATVKFEHSA